MARYKRWCVPDLHPVRDLRPVYLHRVFKAVEPFLTDVERFPFCSAHSFCRSPVMHWVFSFHAVSLCILFHHIFFRIAFPHFVCPPFYRASRSSVVDIAFALSDLRQLCNSLFLKVKCLFLCRKPCNDPALAFYLCNQRIESLIVFPDLVPVSASFPHIDYFFIFDVIPFVYVKHFVSHSLCNAIRIIPWVIFVVNCELSFPAFHPVASATYAAQVPTASCAKNLRMAFAILFKHWSCLACMLLNPSSVL